MKRSRNFGVGIGASSILVIIIILTLICFAGLSLASANADYKLCEKLSQRTQSYYRAVSDSYRVIASEYKKEQPEGCSFEGEYPVTDNQILKVIGSIDPSGESRYELSTFKIVTVEEPKIDSSLSLLLESGK